MLDAGWLDAGYWTCPEPVEGCWMIWMLDDLDAEMLDAEMDAGCWMLDADVLYKAKI